VAENKEEKMNEKISDLHLLLIYLTGWEEDSRKEPGKKIFRAWKGYKFETLDELQEKKLIHNYHNAKSLILTDDGKRKAEELKSKYL